MLAVREWAKKLWEDLESGKGRFEANIQNVETSNGVLIDSPGNLAVRGGYEVDYEKLKSSVSRLKGEEGRVFGDVLRRGCYIPILYDLSTGPRNSLST